MTELSNFGTYYNLLMELYYAMVHKIIILPLACIPFLYQNSAVTDTLKCSIESMKYILFGQHSIKIA